jgi:hypothetical protein
MTDGISESIRIEKGVIKWSVESWNTSAVGFDLFSMGLGENKDVFESEKGEEIDCRVMLPENFDWHDVVLEVLGNSTKFLRILTGEYIKTVFSLRNKT